MIFDTDDVWEGHDRIDLLQRLKAANPAFRMTAFAVPKLGTDRYWDSLPDWIEVAMHGEYHPHPREAEAWSYEKARTVLEAKPDRFVKLWKSPGWQVSTGTYEALEDMGWLLADHPENDARRPEGIWTHVLGDGDHCHTHVDDVCGNGLEETFPLLLERVTGAECFELVSEAVRPWAPVRA